MAPKNNCCLENARLAPNAKEVNPKNIRVLQIHSPRTCISREKKRKRKEKQRAANPLININTQPRVLA